MARCPACKFRYREPEDEQGQHACPRCGEPPVVSGEPFKPIRFRPASMPGVVMDPNLECKVHWSTPRVGHSNESIWIKVDVAPNVDIAIFLNSAIVAEDLGKALIAAAEHVTAVRRLAESAR